MILTEEHRIKKCRDKELFRQIDAYCYRAKNLSNSVNYIISQCYRIHRLLENGEIIDSWEKGLIYRVNCAIHSYNSGRHGKRALRSVDDQNGFIADPYFLSWYMKTMDAYQEMPYATCSQICIQEKCREWKSFYHSTLSFQKEPGKFLGKPRKPGYLDSIKGRGWLTITSQNFRVEEEGNIRMPGFLKGLKIRARNQGVRQIRVRTDNDEICVQLIYEKKNEPATDGKTVMGVDLGIDNLMAVSLDSDASPFIINGRQIKSINRYYNKRRGILQKISKTKNQMNNTKRIERLTGKRNRKINDYLHKSSRKLIEQAQKKNVGLIVIGNNKGWKQKVAMGNRTNQAFVSIPYKKLIDMICYKAELAGIQTRIVEEHYTSGTSYLDGEYPDRESYNKARRIQRGLFQSDKGKLINADINAAYQIMKVAGIRNLAIKEDERVERINVA